MSVEETGSLELFEGKQQEITRQELVERVSEHVNRILRRNLYELKLDERQTFRLLRQKEELRRYLKEAGTGNLQVKEYLISFIQEFLLNGMKMDEEMIKHTFFFSEKGSRQAAVRFDILLFLYKEQYGSGAMEKLIEEHGLLSGTENVITEEQIEHVYGVCGRKLKFIEQIELLSRKIYAYYKGLGAIDELRDMKIDGGLQPVREEDVLKARNKAARALQGMFRELGLPEITDAEVEAATYANGSNDMPERNVNEDLKAIEDMMARKVTGVDFVKALDRAGFPDVAHNIYNMLRQKVAGDYLHTASIFDEQFHVLSAVNVPNEYHGPMTGYQISEERWNQLKNIPNAITAAILEKNQENYA